MTDTVLLEQKIQESGYKTSHIADKLGLTFQGFQNKRKGVSEFYAKEIVILSDLLKLTKREREQIFFNQKVN